MGTRQRDSWARGDGRFGRWELAMVYIACPAAILNGCSAEAFE